MSADEELVMVPRTKLDLLTKAADNSFKLETLVKAYYDEHQSLGCTCALCERAERTLGSIGRASGHSSGGA